MTAKGQIINARSETIAEKKMFIPSLKNGRCLIPASCYFEWQAKDGKKIKHAFSSLTEPIVYLAGISQIDATTRERRFVILTRQAADHISFIHDRMPVILPTSEHDVWLYGRNYADVFVNASEEISFRVV